MSEKFYKLVDGILWADWMKPPDLPQDYSKKDAKAWLDYDNRPHYPLSGTLEGKERYEIDVDFFVSSGMFEPTAYSKATPIAQPVIEGEIQKHEYPDKVMDRVVQCLYLELPEVIADDVKSKWLAVKSLMNQREQRMVSMIRELVEMEKMKEALNLVLGSFALERCEKFELIDKIKSLLK
jgi:hypothetical protein